MKDMKIDMKNTPKFTPIYVHYTYDIINTMKGVREEVISKATRILER